MKLTDYKVRILNPTAASAARTLVLLTSGDTGREWRTVGVSEDIIQASFQALNDSILHFLYLTAEETEKL
jgi:2-isopropylmalate synthase